MTKLFFLSTIPGVFLLVVVIMLMMRWLGYRVTLFLLIAIPTLIATAAVVAVYLVAWSWVLLLAALAFIGK